MDEWIQVKPENPRPKYREFVWGFFKNKEVCLVEHTMSDEEYNIYCNDGVWYSLDDEKTGCVTYWKPLIRPIFTKIEESNK